MCSLSVRTLLLAFIDCHNFHYYYPRHPSPTTCHPSPDIRHPPPWEKSCGMNISWTSFLCTMAFVIQQSYPQFPQSPLGPPGTMTSLLAHAHKKRKRNGCIFRVSQLTYAGLNSRIIKSERNKCKNIKKCMYARWMCSAFWGVGTNICSSVSIPKLCRSTGKCFEETLRDGNDVKNLEIF